MSFAVKRKRIVKQNFTNKVVTLPKILYVPLFLCIVCIHLFLYATEGFPPALRLYTAAIHTISFRVGHFGSRLVNQVKASTLYGLWGKRVS